MKQCNYYTKEYFNKFSTNPVVIKPFDPKTKIIARKYIEEINLLIKKFGVTAELIGSTEFEISGKGEIEIALLLNGSNWQEVKNFLKNHFGKIDNENVDYVRINHVFKNHDVEIILLKGYMAETNKKVTAFLKNNPKKLKEYAEVKRKYSFSKREYQRQKNEFFKKIIPLI